MFNKLQKAINLIKKTGDRLMIFDSAKPDDVYLVMSLKDYENLVLGRSEVRGLTEDQLLDKINRDIAIWKSEQDNLEPLASTNELNQFTENRQEQKTKAEKKAFDFWSIPKTRKEQAEEVIEEDRQYLEEVSF